MDQGTFLYFIFAAVLNNSMMLGNNQTFLAWLDKWLKPLTNISSYWNHWQWLGFQYLPFKLWRQRSICYFFRGYTSQSWASEPSSEWPELRKRKYYLL